MGRYYQERDQEIVDYELWDLPGFPHPLRGPRVHTVGQGNPNYISFLGASQTFGALCKYPFSSLLSEILGIESLNLGFGGAGPQFFLENDTLFSVINQGQCAVVQVMAARTAENSLMLNLDGRCLGRWRSEPETAPPRWFDDLYRELLEKESPARVLEIVEETRERYIQDFEALVSRIEVPCVLLWISRRSPRYGLETQNIHKLYGGFPMLVNERTFSRLSAICDEVVVSIKEGVMSTPLISRFTGKPTSICIGGGVWQKNPCYPSQQEHIQAALDLLPVIKGIIAIR